MSSRSWGVGLHDYISTKLGLGFSGGAIKCLSEAGFGADLGCKPCARGPKTGPKHPGHSARAACDRFLGLVRSSFAAESSATYGCGYHSCGGNLKLSEVRSGSFVVDLGPVWGPLGPKPAPNRSQTIPTGPRTTSNCSHMSCSHVHRSPEHY